MFSIQYLIFLIFKLFETSGIKLIKFRIKIGYIISSSDLPWKVYDIYTKLIF